MGEKNHIWGFLTWQRQETSKCVEAFIILHMHKWMGITEQNKHAKDIPLALKRAYKRYHDVIK